MYLDHIIHVSIIFSFFLLTFFFSNKFLFIYSYFDYIFILYWSLFNILNTSNNSHLLQYNLKFSFQAYECDWARQIGLVAWAMGQVVVQNRLAVEAKFREVIFINMVHPFNFMLASIKFLTNWLVGFISLSLDQ